MAWKSRTGSGAPGMEAALQGTAVIGAERPLEREGNVLGMQPCRAHCLLGEGGGDKRGGRDQAKGNAERSLVEAYDVSHSAGREEDAAESPSTDWAIEAGSFFGVSIRPTIGRISQKKA